MLTATLVPGIPTGDSWASEAGQLTGTVVVVNQASDSVTLIDVSTMEAYLHVSVVGGPHEVDISPDGKRAVVTNYYKRGGDPQKTLSVISLPDGATIKTIDLGEYSTPHDVQWVNDHQVVCTAEANQALLLVNIDTGEIERVFETEKKGSHMLSLSPDRERLYSSNMTGNGSVSVFDFNSGKKITDIDTGNECEGVGVSPDGRWVWAGNRAEDTVSIIDTRSLQLVKTLESPGFPYRVEFTPDGRYALVPHATSGSLMVGDVSAQEVIRHIPLGMTQVEKPSTAGVFPHPDNTHAFVTVRNDNAMLVLNLETGETLARVEVQSSPDGVAYSPVQR
jgi:DNA-binding beta-propeller fold protein YncE